MRTPFQFSSLAIRVLFDKPAAETVAAEVARLSLSRVLMVAMPGARSAHEFAPVADALGGRCAAIFADARAHVPIETLEACLAAHQQANADGVVAIGGGSAIGLAKLVAARSHTPLIAVPTTYSGAEMTPFNAVTERGVKTQYRDPAMVPAAVIYDPDLTLRLPIEITGPSMMNGIAHSIEAMYAPEANPVVDLSAEMSIKLAAAALPRLAARLEERPARRDLLLAAMLAGQALAVTSMGLHHKLCHILGGAYDLPHAGVNAVILPYALAYNAPGAPVAAARIAAALGALGGTDPAGLLFDIAQGTGAPASLAALGLPETALEVIAATAAGQVYANPVPLSRPALHALLADAYAGRRPTVGAYAGA